MFKLPELTTPIDYRTLGKYEDIFKRPARYIQKFLWIKNKHSDIIPFFFNSTQVRYRRMKRIELAKVRVVNPYAKPHYLVLKYRQGGITTEEQGENFHLIATKENQNCITLAHDKKTTEEIFDIAQLFDRNLTPEIRPKRDWDNKSEIEYKGLNSKFHIGTAGNTSFGRGQTFQRVHLSEVPLYGRKKHQHTISISDIQNLISGILRACPYGDVVAEGTGQGAKGWFYQTWNEAKKSKCRNGWIPIFLPWFIDPLNSMPLLSGEDIEYTDEEKILISRAKENYGVDMKPEQIKWRRFMKEEEKLFDQEFPEDDITAFMVSGSSKFDMLILRDLVKDCANPVEEKILDGGSLLQWVKPIAGRRYVIGADVGEGLANSDYSTGTVLDYETCEQVARLMGRWKPEVFGVKLANLGLMYNKALIGVEANNHGHSTLNTLLNTLHYPRLYYHKNYDNTGGQQLGWQTNAKTRDLLIGELKTAIEEYLMKINDTEFIDQCMTFQDDGTGKYQAEEGCFDDLVLAYAIAWQLRKVHGISPRITT